MPKANAFITGSYAYGTPRPDSDVDLVIRCSHLAKCRLETAAKCDRGPVRFGDLNLIICTDDQKFDAWLQGTEELIRRAPVTRDEAKAYLQTLRTDDGKSGD